MGWRLVVALVTWRLANLVGFVLWLLCVPAAALFGWYHSLPFVALASIYANAISHLAAWRADVPNDDDDDDRLERRVEWLEERQPKIEGGRIEWPSARAPGETA